MLTPKPRPSLQTKPKLLPKRPSEFFFQAFQSEEKAQQLSVRIERHPLFQALLADKVIRKVSLQGVIPSERYVADMERYAIAFVHRHRLYDRPEWQQLLTHPNAEEFLPRWSHQWGVSERALRRVVRFLRSQTKERRELLWADAIGEKELAAPVDFGDLSDIIEVASEFVRRYRLTQQEFADYILSGRFSARHLSDRFGCSLAEAQAVLDVLDRLDLQEMFNVTEPFSEVARSLPTAAETLLAEAWVDERNKLHLRLLNDRHTVRYVIDRHRLEAWMKTRGNDPELRPLLEALHALNERGGALAAIAYAVCSAQRAFLASGNLLDLRPLSQADVARQTGYHRSVVCRLIRGQSVKTPHGRLTLRELMPRRREVIARLRDAHPDWTDGQIADELLRRFGIKLSRRAVTYHRHRRHSAAATDAPRQASWHSKGRSSS